jgi:hypothetical protein
MKKSVIYPLLGAALAAGVSFSGTASAFAVGGVEVGPNNQGFSILATQLYEGPAITAAGQTLYGAGQVTALNGSTNFLTSAGLELDYVFSTTNVLLSGTQTVFDGGTLTFFLNTTGTFLNVSNNLGNISIAASIAALSAGTDWLDLAFKTVKDPGGFGVNGAIFGSGTGFSGNNFSGSGVGNLDVAAGAGLANATFNSNFFDVTNPNGSAGKSDFNFASSFSLSNPVAGPTFLPIDGTTRFSARPVAVPEPTSIALIGIVLAGLGFIKRRSI